MKSTKVWINCCNTLFFYDGRKMNSIDLKSNQYCVISDRETGQLRTERGEKLVYRKMDGNGF